MKNMKHQLHGIKRILSAAMAAAVAVTAFSVPVTAFAEQYDIVDDTDGRFCMSEVDGAVSKEWDGSIATSFDGGAGTQADPYRIATGEQLALLAQNVDNGTTYEGSYFTLTADILLNDDVDDEPNKWNSIGADGYRNSVAVWFLGTFDGANHRVIGLYQNGGYSQGLFAWNAGTVKNVSVTDGRIVADDDAVGAVCGRNYGILSNCYSAVKITGTTNTDDFGGVCGNNSGIISNCHNSSELYLTGGSSSNYKESVGGVCGYNNGTISNSYNTGRVYTTSSYIHYISGVAGINYGTINDCYNTGEVNGYDYTGGVCGYNIAGTIKDCYNTGDITGRHLYVGGICGYSTSSNASDVILRCYNKGDVINTYTSNSNGYTGGVCGYLNGYLIRLCYNTASVTTNGTYQTAGVCGYVAKGEIRECYNSGAVTASYNTTGGVVGYLKSNCVVENCYNTGTVKGRSFVGGVWAASDSSSTNSMTNCYNVGTVTGSVSDIFPVGETDGQITNVYYNSDVCTDSTGTNTGWAKTTEELTTSTVLSDLGFDTAKWNKMSNTSSYRYYPDLKNIDGDQPKVIVGVPAPTNVKASAGDGKVTLTWDAVEGATNYAVFLRKGTTWLKIGSSGTNTTFTSRGLENGGKYFYMVKAYVNGAWSGESDAVWAIPLCITPQNVKASAGDSKVTLTWDAVKGASNYAVFLRKGTAWLKIGASGANTTFTSRGLANGGKYFYMVKAYVNGTWSDESAIVSAIPVCITPQNVKAVGGAGQATITWSAVSGATNYAVMMKKGTSWLTLGSTGTTTSYTAKGLASGGKYYFVVKAFVNGAWSDMSETVSASIS